MPKLNYTGFKLYIRKTKERSRNAWFRYITVQNGTKKDRIFLLGYDETAEAVDETKLPPAAEASLRDEYRRANNTEKAKFLLLVKDNGSRSKSR